MWQTSDNILVGSTSYQSNHCASYKVIPVTPKRLMKAETFGKKTDFPAKKLFGPIFSRIIEYENLREPFISVQKGFCDGFLCKL